MVHKGEVNSGPPSLPPGTVLADRFVLEEAIGRGGFAIAYRAQDLQRNDLCVVKELAPGGSVRRSDSVLELPAENEAQAQRLRARFLEEARLLQRLNVRGLLPVRATMTDLGTAFFVTDYVEGASTLEELIGREGPMDPDGALDLIYQLLETLEGIHAKGVLHRDVKPSNVLISPSGEAYLIDFGAAREWHADLTVHHTILYTPGYAPLEQLSERAKRGPATDLYSLCATAYRMLTGLIPPTATDRAAGAIMLELRELRPDIEPVVANAIEAGLALRYNDRPQSVQAIREILAANSSFAGETTLEELDDTLYKLQKFSFDRRACPSCGGLLQELKPLKKNICPVCRRGLIKRRNVSERLCPICRHGTLHRKQNVIPLAFCPLCTTGELAVKRKALIGKALSRTCKACEASFEDEGDGMVHLATGDSKTWDEWRSVSGRSAEVHTCDTCAAQFDTLADGRRQQVIPPPEKYKALYPIEWALVAARQDPFGGDAECDDCGADYALDGDRLSLLHYHHDPFEFGKHYKGRLLTWEDARWLGVGKESPQPGFVCDDCQTEFDKDGDFLRLVRTENPRLVRLVDEPKSQEDWNRLGQGLPMLEHEDEFMAQFPDAIRCAYECGLIGFEKGALWSGPAQRVDRDAQNGHLVITSDEIIFGGLLRKWRAPLDALLGVQTEGNELRLQFTGERDDSVWEVEPVELTVHLRSGNQSIELTGENLAARLSQQKLRGAELEP